MNERFEILQGEGKQSYVDRALRLGGFAIGITKGTVRFGIDFATEFGDALMYNDGQKGYVNALKAREPRDRALKSLRTALRAFDGKGYKPEELSTHAALGFASANHELQKVDPETAIENTPAVVILIEKIPDTHDGARVAEHVAAHGLAAIVDDYNGQERPFPLPRQPQE